ncbi:hypothetical protein ACFLZH_02155 [Patescibacteria group bacterium]
MEKDKEKLLHTSLGPEQDAKFIEAYLLIVETKRIVDSALEDTDDILGMIDN